MNSSRPYFLWDYDLTETQVRAILSGQNNFDRQWLLARILESAKYEDVWKYISLAQLRQTYSALRLKKPIKRAWDLALRTWQ